MLYLLYVQNWGIRTINNCNCWLSLHATKLRILQSSIELVISRDKLCNAKIRATLSEESDWYGNRSVSVPPRNRKFPGRRNSLRVPDHARFRASPWFTWLSRNLAAALPWQRLRGPGIPGSSRDPLFLVLSRFPRSEWLSPIFSFYACTLNFRLSLFLPNYSILFSFPRSVCIRPSLFFRFTRTCWCPLLLYFLTLVFSSTYLDIFQLLFLSLSFSLFLSFACEFILIRLVLLIWLLTRLEVLSKLVSICVAYWFPRLAAVCLFKATQNRVQC